MSSNVCNNVIAFRAQTQKLYGRVANSYVWADSNLSAVIDMNWVCRGFFFMSCVAATCLFWRNPPTSLCRADMSATCRQHSQLSELPPNFDPEKDAILPSDTPQCLELMHNTAHATIKSMQIHLILEKILTTLNNREEGISRDNTGALEDKITEIMDGGTLFIKYCSIVPLSMAWSRMLIEEQSTRRIDASKTSIGAPSYCGCCRRIVSSTRSG